MRPRLLIQNAKIITHDQIVEQGWLLAKGRKIAALGSGDPGQNIEAEVIDAAGLTLLPGFIDLHAHGGDGYDVMQASIEALQGMARYFARSGVTAFLASTWTDRTENIGRALSTVAALMDMPSSGATLLGAHLEGPFLNPEKCGAQHVDLIRTADPAVALPWLDLDVIRLLALAPEFEANAWLIEEAVKRGVTVSVAHSNATYAQVKRAVSLGLSHATHTYNAMSALNHREPGAVGAVLSLDAISCELICDLIHVHPAALRILWRCKGADKIILVTDSVKIAGLPEGRYHFSDQDVVMQDGAVRLAADGTLAGTTLAMNVALRNFMKATGMPLESVWQTASLNPARAIKVDDRKGSVEIGKDADLALVDDELNVQMTIAEGRVIYRRGDAPA